MSDLFASPKGAYTGFAAALRARNTCAAQPRAGPRRCRVVHGPDILAPRSPAPLPASASSNLDAIFFSSAGPSLRQLELRPDILPSCSESEFSWLNITSKFESVEGCAAHVRHIMPRGRWNPNLDPISCHETSKSQRCGRISAPCTTLN